MGKYSRNNNRGYLEDLLYQIDEAKKEGIEGKNQDNTQVKKWYQYIFCCL
jgi:hypothetical protein